MGNTFNIGVVKLPLQVAGRVRELRKDKDFLPGKVFGLEQPLEAQEFVVVFWLELSGFVEKLDDLVEVKESLGEHFLDLVFPAVEPLDGIEHFRRHDVFVLGFLGILILRPKLQLTSRRITQNFHVLRFPPRQPSLFAIRVAMDFHESQKLSQQTVARQLEGSNGALKTLQEVGADQTDDLLLSILLEGVDVLVRDPCTSAGDSTSVT